jgi:hypothetical protein
MLVLAAGGVVLIVASDNNNAEEVGRQLLPASIVGLTVALIAALLDSQIAERSAAEAARERVLGELVRARDQLEAAHLLIQAHRSVETYRDQTVELVRAQGSLRLARALVQSTDPGEKVFEVRAVGVALREVFGFLGEVTDEYRNRFHEAQEFGADRAWRVIESFSAMRRFLDPSTFDAEVRVKLRDAVKSIQASSGGVRTTTSPVADGNIAS